LTFDPANDAASTLKQSVVHQDWHNKIDMAASVWQDRYGKEVLEGTG